MASSPWKHQSSSSRPLGGAGGLRAAGQIQVIFGPMFSGKSTELMRRVRRLAIAQCSCLLVKYANDTRYSQHCIATHDSHTMSAVSVTRLQSVAHLALDFSVIGIDEGQFFPDVVSFSEKMADLGKLVIVAALDGDFTRTGFNDILNLVPIAESVVKLHAVCMSCFGEGSFTKRIGSETALEVIGGSDKYIAACRLCHNNTTHTPQATSPSKARHASPLKSRATPSDAHASPLKSRATPSDAHTSPLKSRATPSNAHTSPLKSRATPSKENVSPKKRPLLDVSNKENVC